LKHLDESVARTLGEILIKHGQSSLTDARLCENLLKDYCGEYKDEISLLVSAVKERVAIDLLVSQDGLPRNLLRDLLVKRLRKNGSLGDAEARWAVDSWSLALRALIRADTLDDAELISSASEDPAEPPAALPPPDPEFGVIGQSLKAIRSVAFSPFGDSVASGGDDGTLRLWNIYTGDGKVLDEGDRPISSLTFSPNGVLLASAREGVGPGEDGVRVWDLQSGECLDLGESGKRAPTVVFSPGGRRLASGSAEPNGVIRVWNLQTGQARVLKGPAGGAASISFSPDGGWIAAADSDLTNAAIRLWDLETGTSRIIGHCSRQITSVAFSPDGQSVASGSWDEIVRLWNVRTGEARVLGKNCSCICCLAFSPKGDQVAACSLDSRIRVWDIATAKSRTVGLCDSVNSIAFSTNGKMLVTGSADGTIRLWSVGV
jgi:tricorn protease-like protein